MLETRRLTRKLSNNLLLCCLLLDQNCTRLSPQSQERVERQDAHSQRRHLHGAPTPLVESNGQRVGGEAHRGRRRRHGVVARQPERAARAARRDQGPDRTALQHRLVASEGPMSAMTGSDCVLKSRALARLLYSLTCSFHSTYTRYTHGTSYAVYACKATKSEPA